MSASRWSCVVAFACLHCFADATVQWWWWWWWWADRCLDCVLPLCLCSFCACASFGAMLRSAGKGQNQKKILTFGACRDLHGRRYVVWYLPPPLPPPLPRPRQRLGLLLCRSLPCVCLVNNSMVFAASGLGT